MRDGAKEALDDANQVVSDLAYWITSCDRDAALRIAEGFGAALAKSASMRSRGMSPNAIALALAERANALSHVKDAQHAGWLLLSVKLELLQLASSASSLPGQQAAELILELDQIMIELLQKGAAALTTA